MEEEWRPVNGYEETYEVSNFGKVRRKRNKKLLVPHKNSKGYLRVGLSKGNKRHYRFIHRLVALAFIPNEDNLPQINHKDEDRLNNNVSNLEWCTAKYNINYGTARERIIQKMRNNPKLSKAVAAYDKENHLVFSFPSIREAERQTKINSRSINFSLKHEGRRRAGGYIWRYQ